jgi:hypothetical protein
MSNRRELAQRLAELPTFNLRFGSRVDIFNLPTEDRDLIVRALSEAEDRADKSHNIAVEFEKLRARILALTAERDEIAASLQAARGENAQLEERRLALAAENRRLEEKCLSLTSEHERLDEKARSLAAEAAALTADKASLVAGQARLSNELGTLATSRNAAFGLLLRLINGETDRAAAAAVVQSQFPERATDLRPAESTRSSGWEPIATAPKDNSPVNLIGRSPGGRWVAPVASRRNMISADLGVDQWLDWEHPFPPSHWCPIPIAPSGAQAPVLPVESAPPASNDQTLPNDLRFLAKAHRG